MHRAWAVTIVVRTVDERALAGLLSQLGAGRLPERVLVVDDRRPPRRRGGLHAIPVEAGGPLASRVAVVAGPRRGPCAARNVGWRAVTTPWVAFLSEDARLLSPDWFAALEAELRTASPPLADAAEPTWVPRGAGPVIGVYGRTQPQGADDDRDDAGHAAATSWATIDAAYRRDALAALGGFDERVERADLGQLELEWRAAGRGRFARGDRTVAGPVATGPGQAGLLDQRARVTDALLTRLHGRGWRAEAGLSASDIARHLAVSAAVAASVVSAATALLHRRRAAWLVTTAAASLWAASTARAVAQRLTTGPRGAVARAGAALLSPIEPLAASRWWLSGTWRARHAGPWGPPRPRAVLFERAVLDAAVAAVNAAPSASSDTPAQPSAMVQRLRREGVEIGVLVAEPDIAAGLASATAVDAAHGQLGADLGGVDTWAVCPHSPGDGCDCRPPQPALVHRAAERLGLAAADCVVVSEDPDFQAAAVAAGARGIRCASSPPAARDMPVAIETEPSLERVADVLLGRRPAGGGPAPFSRACFRLVRRPCPTRR